MIEHTEQTIHEVVREREQGATPPALEVIRRAPDSVLVQYDSPRRMCAFAIGIANGIARCYGERLAVEHPLCTLMGHPVCEITLTLDPVASVPMLVVDGALS
ncbi:MAG: heme NO-binding domain-containing protein [Solirubrobacteraceae bacterium]